ncbi:MAG: Hsp33 family molecular chaperone HslO, partial [Nisaea sp.]
HPVAERCRCSKDRVESVLKSLSDEEIQDMTVDGLVFVVCEFCKTRWDYDEAGIEELRASTEN